MKTFLAIALAVTTVVTIAVMWVPGKWPTSVPEVAMCVLAAVWGLSAMAGKTPIRLAFVAVPLAGVVLLAVFQLFAGITVYPWPTRMAALYWAGNLATFLVALQVFSDRSRRVRYMNALLIFGAILSVLSIAQYLTAPRSAYWYFDLQGITIGPFLYVNQYAAFIELILPLAIYTALTRNEGRFLTVAAIAVMAGSVFYTGSRGGSFLVIVEIILVPMLITRGRELSRSRILNTAAVLVVALLWVGVAASPELLLSKLSGGRDQLAGRREFNQSSIAMIKARPLQGFGLGNWPTAYPGYALFDDGLRANQAHDDWLQWAVEGGIPLFLIMVSVAVWAIPRAVRSVWGLGVAIIFVHCLWDYPIQRTGVAMVFFTMMAAIAPYGRPDKAVRAEPDEYGEMK